MVKIDLNASSLPGQLDHDKAAAMFLPHCGPTPARGGLPPPTTIQRIQAKDPEGNPIGGENWVFSEKPKTQQPSNSTSGYASGQAMGLAMGGMTGGIMGGMFSPEIQNSLGLTGLIKGDLNVGKKSNGEVTVKVQQKPKPAAKPETQTETKQTQPSQVNNTNQTSNQPQLVNPYPQLNQKTPTGPVSGVGPQLGVGPNLKVGPQLGVGPNITTGPRLGVGPSNIPYQGQMGINNNNQNNFQRNNVGSNPNQNMAKPPVGLQMIGKTNVSDPKNNQQNLPKEQPAKPEPEPEREIYKTMYPDSEVVKYEGEMKLGKRHGYGKSNYRSGKLMYEGMFVNDMPDDNGKTITLYYENGNIMYEGKCTLGVKAGFGKIFWDNGPTPLL